MTLEDYQSWFVHDNGHWYVSKVKQYKPSAIQEFAKGLEIINRVVNAKPKGQIFIDYSKFRPSNKEFIGLEKKKILINDYSKLYICLLFLREELINLSHLESTNHKKFQIFSSIQKEFIEGKDFNFFIEKYTKPYLNKNLLVYYRNFKSWLGKYGFYGEYSNKTAFITDMGWEFVTNSDDIEISSALFSNQIKRFQFWNPTIDDKYKDYKIRPFFLLLDVISRIEDQYFSKEEYVLFITKIKGHSEKEINDQLKLLTEFRALDPEKKKEYIEELNVIDKKKFKKRKRTNYDRLFDSSSKEISCYGYGGLIEKGAGRFIGQYVLVDKSRAEKELNVFNKSTKFIEFADKQAWISHLGSLEGLSMDSIIEMYIDSGMSIENIKSELSGNNTGLLDSIEVKLYEKEIEDYYIQNITEIHPDIEVIKEPQYGRQFNTHVGPIDILCWNKKTEEYVICELKRGQTSDETVGQILRYMGWVYEHLSESSKPVRGILIGSEFDKKVDYALKGVQNESIYELIKMFKHPFNEENQPSKK